MKRKHWIIIIVIILVLLVGGVFVFSEVQQANGIRKAVEASDVSTRDFVKSTFDYYYVLHGKYPEDIKELMEGLPQNDQKYIANTQKLFKGLKNFTYNVRGDEQAYKVMYTNYYGERKEIQGNYQKDFH